MTEAEQVMKRCQIGTRNYDEANNLHADCYRVIGKLLAEKSMRETQRLGQEIEQEIEQEPKIGCVNHDCDQCKAQPEQEPVALHVYKPTLPRGHLGNVSDGDLPWVYDQDPSSGYSARMLVYTTPPQRTWVGLEKSDMPDGADPLFDDPKFIAGMVYAANKLKEKNT